jgi:LytS/YehU family sensor histidine kinase
MIFFFSLLISVLLVIVIYQTYSIDKSKGEQHHLEQKIRILEGEDWLKEKRITELDAAKYRAELKLTAFQVQMNRHFIFNALNTIQSFIIDNKADLAINYLGNFSKLLRTVLENSDKPFIELKTELEILKIYLEIESTRFADRIKFQLDVDEALLLEDIKVPSFSLQPFIENCIKHAFNGKSTNNQVTVEISRSQSNVQYVVRDNGMGLNASLKKNNRIHKSKGVETVKKKLEMLGEGDYTFSILDLNEENENLTGTRVVIKFPALENIELSNEYSAPVNDLVN